MSVRDASWLTLAQVARELGMTRRYAQKALRKVEWAIAPQGDPPRYDARLLDLIRAMHDKPHRTLEEAHKDWLARYLEGAHDGRNEPDPGGPPRSPQP